MVARVVRRLLLVGVLLILPTLATAQEATLSGTVVDATGGVLPGATLTAVLEASGNTFEGVTDERGVFRIAARAGVSGLRRSLPGVLDASSRSGLELLVGQQAVANLQMSPVGVARVDYGVRERRRFSTSARPVWVATSTRGRRRNCRSTAATG